MQAVKCLLLFALIGTLAGALSGCGNFFVKENGSGGTTATGDYIYVGNGNNFNIAGFGVSTTGALSVLSNSPYNNGIAVKAIAITPANTFLYAGTLGGIYVYSIGSNGSIAVQNSGNSVAQDVFPSFMQIEVDSNGTYLLAAGISLSLGAQVVGIYAVDTSTGLLTALTGSPLALYTGVSTTVTTPTVVSPTGMLITPNNSYVYVSLGSLGVQVLTLGTGGALNTGTAATILPPISTSSSPTDLGLASDPNSAFLFVAETNTGLRVLSIGTGGSLREITGSPYAVGTGPRGVALDSTGSYVYVTNYGSNNISAFALTPTSGMLTAIAGSPFASGGLMPTVVVNDNQKKYLAVINSGANGATGSSDLQLFSFDATTAGKLNPVSTASTGTDPTNPQSVAASH